MVHRRGNRNRPGARRTSIAPGASVDDIWWFARPANTVTELLLRAPGKRFGDTGLIRFKLPYIWSDPRQFAEIMPVPAGAAAGQ